MSWKHIVLFRNVAKNLKQDSELLLENVQICRHAHNVLAAKLLWSQP